MKSAKGHLQSVVHTLAKYVSGTPGEVCIQRVNLYGRHPPSNGMRFPFGCHVVNVSRLGFAEAFLKDRRAQTSQIVCCVLRRRSGLRLIGITTNARFASRRSRRRKGKTLGKCVLVLNHDRSAKGRTRRGSYSPKGRGAVF